MLAQAYQDNFDNLAGFTASGLTASGNKVYATSGGTIGYFSRAWSATQEQNQIASAVFSIDKTDTAGRYAFLGLMSALLPSGGYGCGVRYEAGVGFKAAITYGDNTGLVDHGSSSLILADASITTGDYLARLLWDNTLHQVVVQIYRDNATCWTWVAGGVASEPGNDYWHATAINYLSNSAKTKISRLAFDPNPFGSIITEGNAFAEVVGSYSIGGSSLHKATLYMPGAAFRSPICAIQLHAAGESNDLFYSNNTFTRTAPSAIFTGCMGAGVPVASLSCYSEVGSTGDSWGNDSFLDELDDAVSAIQSFMGEDVGFAMFGRSMGGGAVARAIAAGRVPNIKGAMMIMPATGFVKMAASSYSTSVATAWPDADYMAAQDPNLFANTARFADVKEITVVYNADDVNVVPADNVEVLLSHLDRRQIPYTKIRRTLGAHSSLINPADVGQFLNRLLSETVKFVG